MRTLLNAMKMKYLYALLIISSLTSCVNVFKISDLRTDLVKLAPDEIKGKRLITEMGIAHQINNWKKIETYSVNFNDEFYGIVGKNSHPFSENKINFKLDYIAKSFDGKLTLKSGKKKGEIWGIQSWKTYFKKKDKNPKYKKNKDTKFWLPTYQYFIEFPNRIQEANKFVYAGDSLINNIHCEGILVSWNKTSPQKKIDQYLIWVNKDSKRIVKLEYTIREYYKFLTGAVYFNDYKDYNGIIIPVSLPVESNLTPKKLLHKMTITDFVPNKVSKKEILLQIEE